MVSSEEPQQHGEVLQSRVALYFFPRSSLFLHDDFHFEPTSPFSPLVVFVFSSRKPLFRVHSPISCHFRVRTGVSVSDSLCLTRIHPAAPGSNTAAAVAARYELIGGSKGGTSRLEWEIHSICLLAVCRRAA